jgi:bidirectional [NiFe] hydrogenase diaphorase subunit
MPARRHNGCFLASRHSLAGEDLNVPELSHPGGDRRFRVLDVTMKRYQYQPDALIEVLHKAQELFGYLDLDVLFHIARGLRLPPSRVYGVATFYHLFCLKPQGRHTCVICMGTACFVNGAERLLRVAEQFAGIRAGQTTPNKQVSLLTVRCLGACGIAPAAVYDGTTRGRQTPDGIVGHLREWLAHGP